MKNFLNTKYLIIIIVLLSIFIATLFGFHTFEKPAFAGVQSVDFVSMDSGVFTGRASLRIENKNYISISGKDIAFNMYYKNHLIAKGGSTEEVKLVKKSISNLPIAFQFYIDSVVDDLNDLLLYDSIKMEAHLTGKFTLFNFQVHDKMEVWVNTKELIDGIVKNTISKTALTLKEVKLLEITPMATHLSLMFEFVNNLPVAFTVDTMNLDVFADRMCLLNVGKCKLPAHLRMPVNASEKINSEVLIDNLNLGLAGIAKVLSGSLDYFISGAAVLSVDARTFKIPLKQHIVIHPMTQSIDISKD